MPHEIATADALEVPELTPGARRILETASQLFYRHGIHAVGVDRIAAESGVTKRTLYDRFGSKDALVAAYLSARHQAWWSGLEERLAQADGSRVLVVFDAYADETFTTDRGCAFLNALAELQADDPAHPVVRAHKAAVRSLLAELVREEVPGAEAKGTADHLFLLLEGAIVHRGIDAGGGLSRAARRIAAGVVGVAS